MLQRILLAFLLAMAIGMFSACGSEAVYNPVEGATRIITDVWGREVEIPVNVETIVTLGPGATRIAAYLNVLDMIVGAETQTANFNVLMDFNPIVHEMFSTLLIVGRGGGSGENNAYIEELIMVAPDIVLAAFTPEGADELQSQSGIPVVAVRYSSMGLANETFFAATRVFGEAVGEQERAEEVLAYIEALKADLNRRTADVPDNEKLRVYAGAITFAGQRGFGGTYSNFGPLAVINSYNVADTALEAGFYEVDFEQIAAWDSDIIFLDPGNMSLVNAEYETNPTLFRSLRAVQEGRVYTMPAFNFSATNVTYALINAYFAGTVLFPEQFADVDISEKSAEILTFFLGTNTFDIMAEGGLFYGAITIGE
ncbi:MAG: ABC transporter substrate-binding protein [Defluviitaleaceae bacterium]|nr:ABC transporter substrate-binding protein [Defluviitaleaceae bacterium]